MSKWTRIVGIVMIMTMVLQVASMRHWGEMFAYILALGSWGLACLQQSRLDDAQRELDKLKKRLDSN